VSVLAELEVGQIYGPTPAWVELGPTEERNGLKVRKVLGDWSHFPPCDRLPEYLVDGIELSARPHPFNKGEDRESVNQTLPGRSVSELRGIHTGAVAILFNGPSLATHDLFKIRTPIIGMNRTHRSYPGYRGPQPDYLCLVDWEWFDNEKKWPTVRTHPAIINGSSHSCERCPSCKSLKRTERDPGWRVTRFNRMAPFSFDLARDGYVAVVPCTTAHLALQIAVWMGFTELYCLGLDLGGPHFDNTNASQWLDHSNRYHRMQAPLLKERGIKVFVTGSPKSRCTAFLHASFGEVC
jgi:hypothetical protein